jgi:GMP synthase PP-ATPase subunit
LLLKKQLKLKQCELADLLGISDKQLKRCEYKGGVLAFRFYAAIRAVQLEATKRANRIIEETNKLLDINNDDELN